MSNGLLDTVLTWVWHKFDRFIRGASVIWGASVISGPLLKKTYVGCEFDLGCECYVGCGCYVGCESHLGCECLWCKCYLGRVPKAYKKQIKTVSKANQNRIKTRPVEFGAARLKASPNQNQIKKFDLVLIWFDLGF